MCFNIFEIFSQISKIKLKWLITYQFNNKRFLWGRFYQSNMNLNNDFILLTNYYTFLLHSRNYNEFKIMMNHTLFSLFECMCHNYIELCYMERLYMLWIFVHLSGGGSPSADLRRFHHIYIRSINFVFYSSYHEFLYMHIHSTTFRCIP